MFQRSGLSIAVANASEEVRRQAMHVSTSNADEGFANAVEQFILPRAVPAGTDTMKATGQLNRLGQSLWLDNITRDLLTSGTLQRYIYDLSVTGLTSNPTIFEQAIKNSSAYDAVISAKRAQGKSGEELFFELALEDIRRAADLFRPIYDRTNGIDGWVSLEVSPLLAYDTAATIAAAKTLSFGRAGRPNIMIKIPGTAEGLPAIEEAIYAGIPINVTLLFSREHYFGAAEAFLRGMERRLEAGLRPDVASVASVFVSRWDSAVASTVPDSLRNQLGIAMAKRTYKAYRSVLSSPRWQRVYNAGGRPQRLLWASTGTKDPAGIERHVHQGAGRAVHGQHDPRGDVEGARGSRRALGPSAGQRRGLREGAEAVHRGRRGSAGARGQAADRRRRVVRQVVALVVGGDRLEERGAHGSLNVRRVARRRTHVGAAFRRPGGDSRMRVLVVDIGGTNVKILASGRTEPRKTPSGPGLTPRKMVAAVKELAAGLGVRRGRDRLSGPGRRWPHHDGTEEPWPGMGPIRFQVCVRMSGQDHQRCRHAGARKL